MMHCHEDEPLNYFNNRDHLENRTDPLRRQLRLVYSRVFSWQFRQECLVNFHQRHINGLWAVWPDKNRQMSMKVAQKWQLWVP